MDAIKKWWSRPFSPEMDGTSWFLFFGFLILLSIGWGSILRLIKANA